MRSCFFHPWFIVRFYLLLKFFLENYHDFVVSFTKIEGTVYMMHQTEPGNIDQLGAPVFMKTLSQLPF